MSQSDAPEKLSIYLGSEDDTVRLAKCFASHATAGLVVLLDGQIGAGKTFFARALIQDLLARSGVMEDVPSPTFTLVQSYDTDACPVWHADLYRLTSPDELIELGLEEAMEEAFCLIEWPDRLGDMRLENAITLEISTMPDKPGRRCEINLTALPPALRRDLIAFTLI